MMNLDFKNPSISKILLLLNLGILHALKYQIITLNEAEDLLYSPYAMKILKKNKISDEIVDIIHLGTELEDVVSLGLNLNQSIDDMIHMTEKVYKEIYGLSTKLD